MNARLIDRAKMQTGSSTIYGIDVYKQSYKTLRDLTATNSIQTEIYRNDKNIDPYRYNSEFWASGDSYTNMVLYNSSTMYSGDIGYSNVGQM